MITSWIIQPPALTLGLFMIADGIISYMGNLVCFVMKGNSIHCIVDDRLIMSLKVN